MYTRWSPTYIAGDVGRIQVIGILSETNIIVKKERVHSAEAHQNPLTFQEERAILACRARQNV